MFGGDIRTPARLVRWIEIYNAGASEIPAFGATEITGEEQPESGGTLTPAAGRTVLQVQRPRCDSAKKVVFNGQTPLGVGKYGWGTMDMPAWALSETATNGKKVGTEKDSYELKEEKAGFVVLGGSYNGATRVSVPLSEVALYDAVLDEDLCGGSAQISQLTKIGSCCDDESITGTKQASNKYNLRGCSGDAVLVLKVCSDSDEEEYRIIQVVHKELDVLLSDPYYEECELKFPKRTIVAQHCCLPTEEDILSLYEHTYVADSKFTKAGYTAGTAGTGQQTCYLKHEVKYGRLCGFDVYSPDSSWTDVGTVHFSPKQIQVDTIDDGTCLQKVRQWVYLVCWDDYDTPEDIVCTEECEEGT